MENWLTHILTVVEIVVGLIAIIGFLWGGFVMIIKPIKKLVIQTKENKDNNTKLLDALENKIIPFIDSMTYQFAPNSGKSIKDKLDRIDDNIRLGELRSKMISNSLISMGVYECSPDGNCVWVNTAMADLFGMSKDEMLGNGWFTGVKADERERVWKAWHMAITDDLPYEAEYTVVNQKTRKETKIRTTAVAHKNLDGEVLGYYGSLFAI